MCVERFTERGLSLIPNGTSILCLRHPANRLGHPGLLANFVTDVTRTRRWQVLSICH